MTKFIVLDTEAAPMPGCEGCQPEKMLVYDLGWIVTDEEGIIYEQRSIVINETFDNYGLMLSAYYCDKIPMYYMGIKEGTWSRMSFKDAMRLFASDVREYGVKDVWAYNARFDWIVLNNTVREYSNGYKYSFFPYNVRIRCIMEYAKNGITTTKKYLRFCEERGLLTPKGRPRVTAEAVFTYLSENDTFKEAHTALEDAKIELSILKTCKQRHYKAPKPLNKKK